jgi:hypothetical protein
MIGERPVIRAILTTAFVLGQAVALLVAGIATLYWSSDLMGWLIHLVGEERALGASNVVHLEGGGKLLTNPSAMVRWMLPFWCLGAVQIGAAITMVWLWVSRIPRLTRQRTRPAAVRADPIESRLGGSVR